MWVHVWGAVESESDRRVSAHAIFLIKRLLWLDSIDIRAFVSFVIMGCLLIWPTLKVASVAANQFFLNKFLSWC